MEEKPMPCPNCQRSDCISYVYNGTSGRVHCCFCGYHGPEKNYHDMVSAWNEIPRTLCSVANASDILNSEGTQ